VALLNIAMNIKGLQMGKQLQDFKAETLALSPPLRGDRLTVNSFIRSRHNSFASRIDLLDVDLRLDNNIEATEKKSKRRSSPKKGRRRPSRPDEYAFHFIAYVSANGSVWELDGLQPSPNKLGLRTCPVFDIVLD
jgi:ubiquitin carboxyl-terminal hydrolase L5